MSHQFINRLGGYVKLSRGDQEMLRQLVRDAAWFEPGYDLVEEGTTLRQVSVILDGWACSYKQIEDGRRQIIAYLIPGDMCNTSFAAPDVVNYSVSALTRVRAAQISDHVLLSTISDSPCITRAFWLDLLATSAIQREWTANLGLRTAKERLAHLLCEIMIRMRAVGLTDSDSCTLPLTQEALGDTVGISTVHVNRVLQQLRASGLITLKHQKLSILDFPALQHVAHFDGSYLQCRQRDFDAHPEQSLPSTTRSMVLPNFQL